MSPVAAVILGETSGCVQGKKQNSESCQQGTETPFLQGTRAASFPDTSLQHSAGPTAEPALDKLPYRLLAGSQLLYNLQ